jgi:hypothetical protein
MKHVLAASLLLGLVACAATKPKQANMPQADEFRDSGESDMAAAEKGTKPVIKDERQQRSECCQQCASGLAQDKTGDDPAKVPCADYTWVLKEDCLAFFRKTPMTAADAKTCAAESASPDAAK